MVSCRYAELVSYSEILRKAGAACAVRRTSALRLLVIIRLSLLVSGIVLDRMTPQQRMRILAAALEKKAATKGIF